MIIEVGHEKGGVGKSTLAINLAAYFAQNKKNKVVLVDTDESGSSSRWGELRTHNKLEQTFTIVGKAVDPTAHILKLSEVFNVVIVDVGAGDYARLAEMSRIVDLWIAPTGVGQKEGDSNINLIEAFQRANSRHKNGKIPLVFAFNKTPSSANSLEAQYAAEALSEAAPEVTVLKSRICDRKIWRDADREGRSIFEMQPKARFKAEAEFSAMVDEALRAYSAFNKKVA